MKKIYFVTGNGGKVTTLQCRLEKYGINVEQKKLDLIELQSDDIKKISLSKAEQAHAILKSPLIVDDSGFFIECLNGFPGVYTRFILDTIGIEGIMDLMNGKENRNCGFRSVATFIDVTGKAHVFEGHFEKGTIAIEVDSDEREEAWSALWKIYIPDGYDKTLSQFTPQERSERKVITENCIAFAKFAEWVSTNTHVL